MYSLAQASEFSFKEGEYVTGLCRTVDGLVSISSDQYLTQFSLDIAQGSLRSLKTNHGNLACVEVVDHSSIVCTAGRNGTAAIWDLRMDSAQVAQFQAADAPILSLACNGATNSLAVGTDLEEGQHEVSIFIWDVRGKTTTHRQKYVEVHSKDITKLQYHRIRPNLLLSGSADGLVNVCDTSIVDEDETIVQTFNHNASIHHAGFLSDTDVFAVSNDERFALYSLAENVETGAAVLDYGDIRPRLDCQYVANVTAKNDDSGAIVGAGAQDKHQFTLTHLSKDGQSWSLDASSCVGLPGAHGEELVRDFCFLDQRQIVFTGGEDGKIKSWRPAS